MILIKGAWAPTLSPRQALSISPLDILLYYVFDILAISCEYTSFFEYRTLEAKNSSILSVSCARRRNYAEITQK